MLGGGSWKGGGWLVLFFGEPLFHAAGDVGDVGEAVFEHPASGARGAKAGRAVDEVFGILGKIAGSFGPAAERKELRSLDVGHHVFILFADVEEDAFESSGEDLAEFKGGDFREFGHVVAFLSELMNGGVFAAKRAVGVAFDFDFAEGGGEGPVVDEATQRRGPDSGEELDRFHGLQGADDSREHAQDASFGSCRDRAFGREFRQKATVTGATEMGGEDRDLSLELKNGAVDEGLFQKKSGVVGGEAGGEIIGSVDEGVVRGKKVGGAFGGEAAGVEGDFDVGVDPVKAVAGALEFRTPDAIAVVKNLTVKIGKVHGVGVDEADVPDPGGGKVEEGGGAESAGPDTEDGSLFEPLLPCFADFGEHGLTQVTVGFLRGERHGGTMCCRLVRGKERLRGLGRGVRLCRVRVAIVAHPRKPDAPMAVRNVRESLQKRGIEVVLEEETAELVGEAGEKNFVEGVDLVISLGGDGTLLETLHRIGPTAAPIAGVNIGTLGFLTACTDEEIDLLSDHLESGKMNIVERSLLCVEMIDEKNKAHEFLALNEAVLMRGETGRLVSLEARVNGELLNHFRADGLIVATPTGSTAYSMAAGGPLLGPGAGVFVITPICPHSMSNRALVVEEGAVIELSPCGNGEEPILFSVDGRDILRLKKDSVVRVTRHSESLRLVRLPGHSFYETLRGKLHWR